MLPRPAGYSPGLGHLGTGCVYGQAGHDGHGEPAVRPGAPQSAFNQLGHPFLEHSTAARQPLLDGVFAQSECAGDLSHRAVLAVEEDQGLAIRLGNSFQGLPDERLLLSRDRFLGGVEIVGG